MNISSREDILKILNSYIDLDYKKFQIKIGINDDHLLGVRMPILKKIAKNIIKNDYHSFLSYNQNDIYEEKIIYSLVIGQITVSFNELILLIEQFLPYINDWSVCDILCGNIKNWQYHLKEGYSYLLKKLEINNIWFNRFVFVMFLKYYINDTYIDKIINICIQFNTDNYYVKMSIAWLLAECYYYYPLKIKKLLESKKLDSWIHNKTIQKIKESNKIKQKYDINYINSLRIKNS